DQDTEITPLAHFNIGSNAKSMLATAAARLSEQGRLDLDASLQTVWPEAAATAPDKSEITLAQLLAHSSGLPAFDTGRALEKVPDFTGGDVPVTQATAMWFLQQPLVSSPGKKTLYSNAGYIVAGGVLERITGLPFESILREALFEPLQIDAAFGEPRHLSAADPFGHYVSKTAVTPYIEDEPPIPPYLTAAGNVALSMEDYVTYLQVHLCGLQGRETGLLSAETVRRLHTAALEDGAALGWGITEFGGEVTSFHIGGTGDFTAYVALSPGQDKGVAALLNVGGVPAAPLRSWLIDRISP
ncbi:MAG: serine hydrolase domain-containing protein, partial [Pseudomonadota bacterium]